MFVSILFKWLNLRLSLLSTEMVDRISFAHLNAHSLTSEPLYNNVFSLISKRKYNVLIVSETHTNKAFKIKLNKLYPHVHAICNHAEENKAGICILFPQGLIRIEK